MYWCWQLSHEIVIVGLWASSAAKTMCYQCILWSTVCKKTETNTSKSCRCVLYLRSHTFTHTSTALFYTFEIQCVILHIDAHLHTHRRVCVCVCAQSHTVTHTLSHTHSNSFHPTFVLRLVFTDCIHAPHGMHPFLFWALYELSSGGRDGIYFGKYSDIIPLISPILDTSKKRNNTTHNTY